MKLVDLWDRLPQQWRDASGRFVKVVSAAAAAAAGAYFIGALFGAKPIDPNALWAAVAIAAVSAAEKFFNVAPKVSAKVGAKVRKG